MAARPTTLRRAKPDLTLAEYRALANLRYEVRRFLRFSEQAARQSGLEPRQHQLLLALKGLPQNVRPRIGELAERLQIRNHSAVELSNRLAAQNYVQRKRGEPDRREVLLFLTRKGEKVLRLLSLQHRKELRTWGPELVKALKKVTGSGPQFYFVASKSKQNRTRER